MTTWIRQSGAGKTHLQRNRKCRLKSPTTPFREWMGILVVVAVVSMTLTVHLGRNLSWLGPIPLNTFPDPDGDDSTASRLNTHRALQISDYHTNGKNTLHRKADNKTVELSANAFFDVSATKYKAILKVLQEIETTILYPLRGSLQLLVAGSNPRLEKNAAIVESAFERQHTNISYLSLNDSDLNVSKQLQDSNSGHWSVLLCLNSSNQHDSCVVAATHNLITTAYQKVNIIPQLQNLLLRPAVLCEPDTLQGKGHWCSSSIECVNISSVPELESGNHTNANAFCRDHPVLVVPSVTSSAMQIILCKDHSLRASVSGVALRLNDRLLNARDLNRDDIPDIGNSNCTSGADEQKTTVWQFLVLVASLSPIRAYLHPAGVAWNGLWTYLQHKQPHHSLSLKEMEKMVSDLHGDNAAIAMVESLEESIMKILVKWELASKHAKYGRLCHRCYQVLQMTVLMNTTFHPFILEIGASTLEGHMSSFSKYLMQQTSLTDLSIILADQREVSGDLAYGLLDMGLTTVAKNNICNTEKNVCLTAKELIYLLDGLRERISNSSWRRIYPSTSGVHYTSMLHAGHFKFVSSRSLQNDDNGFHWKGEKEMTTASLHSLVLGLESFFQWPSESSQQASYEDFNIPIDQLKDEQQDTDDTRPHSYLENQFVTGPLCSDELPIMPYLSAVLLKPKLSLKPEFNPLVTDYKAEVETSIQLISIWAWPQSCYLESRFENRHNTDRYANFTLGLGENVLHVYVVDTTSEESWILNTYTLTVSRKDFDFDLSPLGATISKVVCSLKQDCSLPYAVEEPCGLQYVTWVTSWQHFLSHQSSLPECNHGDISGQWYVPCSHCRDDKSSQCKWHEAVWHSPHCQEPVLSEDKLQKCFDGKKVLFIGDSTNRGIQHYLMQRVNGSLWQWDKTHHLRLYSSLNHNRTVFSFAYYPQFWLPAQHRPVFDKALYQLIRRTMPLSNTSNTVLVVGGVHWLATHHLKVVMAALAREGLTGIQVIVKGLGSGFHHPVSGVHQLSKKEQERLFWHNQHLLAFAKENRMEVVDTFNMTMARYSHFLQGKCSCHFHRVTPEKRPRQSQTTFKVEGNINSAYAEMVINRICKPS